jgi:hypothetical protein
VAVVRSGRWRAAEVLAVAILLLGAGLLRAHALDLPGPNPDEFLYALPGLQLSLGDPVRAYVVEVGGQALPVALDGYLGGLPIYVHWLVNHLTAFPLRFRLVNIAYALIAIGFTYGFARAFLGVRAAIYAAVLMATMPSLVFFSRIGEAANFLRLVWIAVGLFYGYRWAVTREWRALYGASLAMGLGLSTRLETVWWMIAVVGYLVVLDRARLGAVAALLQTHRRQAGVALLWVVIGASLLIAYNLQTGGGTLRQVGQSLPATQAGHHNLALAQNAVTRVRHLRTLLAGSHIWGMRASYRNRALALVFCAAVVALLAMAVAGRIRRRPDRKAEFLLFVLAAVLVQSTFSVTTINVMHLLIIMPVPVLILAKALDLPPVRLIGAAAVAVLALVNLRADALYYQHLASDGGRGVYSPGIYRFVDDLERRGVTRVVGCDWGIAWQVYYLSFGRIKFTEIAGFSPRVPASFSRELETALSRSETHFIFRAPRYAVFPREAAFLAYVRAAGLEYRRRVVSDRHGPLFIEYEITERDHGARPGLQPAVGARGTWASVRAPRTARRPSRSPARSLEPRRWATCSISPASLHVS